MDLYLQKHPSDDVEREGRDIEHDCALGQPGEVHEGIASGSKEKTVYKQYHSTSESEHDYYLIDQWTDSNTLQ